MQHRSQGDVGENDPSAAGPDTHLNFDAPAILRKWPSLNNQRRTNGIGPYLLLDGTLDECIREFMAKPAPGDTYMWFILHHSPRWWVPYYLKRSLLNSPGFGIFSDPSDSPCYSSSMENRHAPKARRRNRPFTRSEHRPTSVNLSPLQDD